MNHRPVAVAIVDLEATCWPQRGRVRTMHMEVIEIGAVLHAPGDGNSADEFGAYVRPVANPRLSSFCVELTGITQAQADAAERFPHVFARFTAWLEQTGCRGWGSWGHYDFEQLWVDPATDTPQFRQTDLAPAKRIPCRVI